ncbi:hypothetical protein HMPREF1226_1676 [Streptococcus pyogenes UTMEM-1]|nr:hypothetical protein HMPREF1225_0319 [Streptococcus pyogenes UTSW-2]EQL81008.1 hypothetical protein HMPREF1226_1676 [Streptococcus pyogenes UTMEM-1]ESA56290.1 hypothetical protein HMPREF1238_1258 [Streptococcus pyogenes GA40377]SDV89818.1 hypothetical protein ISR9_1237 [Streptococcus pyogenes]
MLLLLLVLATGVDDVVVVAVLGVFSLLEEADDVDVAAGAVCAWGEAGVVPEL